MKLYLAIFSVLFLAVFPLLAEAGDHPVLDSEFAAERGWLCGEGPNAQRVTAEDIRAGVPICVGGRRAPLRLGKTIQESISAEEMKNLVAGFMAIPKGSWVVMSCSVCQMEVKGCQKALAGMRNACYAAVALARCQNGYDLLIQHRPDLKDYVTQVAQSIQDTRQVTFKAIAPQTGGAKVMEKCTKDQVDDIIDIVYAGNHTRRAPERWVFLKDEQDVPNGFTLKPVTLTMKGSTKAKQGKDGPFSVVYPERVDTCHLYVSDVKEQKTVASSHKEEVKTPTPPVDTNPPVVTNKALDPERLCEDKIDNDGDGKTDCEDQDCKDLFPATCAEQSIWSKIVTGLELQAEFRQGVPPRWAFEGPGKENLTIGQYSNVMLALGMVADLGKKWYFIPGVVGGTQTNQFVNPNETVLQGEVHSFVLGGQMSLLKELKPGLLVGGTVGTFVTKGDLIPYVRGVVRLRVLGLCSIQLGLGVDGYEHRVNGDAVVQPTFTLSAVCSTAGTK